MSTQNDNQATKVIVGEVRLSYLHIWEPVAIEEGAPKKYSASLIIPKGEKKLIAAINKAIEAAKELGKKKFHWDDKVFKSSKFKMPLRDGDEERPEDDNYANSLFLNASCSGKPGVVDAKRQPVIEQDQVYSGCYGYASVNFYPFDKAGNRGIACGLNNLMKSKDGEALGGRSSAESDFADLEIAAEEADDLL